MATKRSRDLLASDDPLAAKAIVSALGRDECFGDISIVARADRQASKRPSIPSGSA
jgi:hypothetical protein